MLKKSLKIIGILVLLLVVVLVVNTLKDSRSLPVNASQAENIQVDDSAALHLSQAIQIKTISFGDTLAIDTTEFLKFRKFMESTYPTINTKLPRQIFNQFSYVYKWTGKDTTLAPYVLMGHMDVVPVEAVAESKWTVPSFSGAIKNDTIWGRGAVDDKVAVIAIMEAVEQLLKENYTPNRTVYLCFGHDEEISGKRGAKIYSQWFKEQNIKPAMVLDEGGQIDTKHFAHLNRPMAIIGTSEKGYVNIDLTVEIPGGHSSMPSTETAIDVLNKAIVNIRAHQMPGKITPTLLELLNRTKPAEKLVTKVILSNLWLFNGAVMSQLEKTKETNAMIHTTLVPTIVHSGIKDNVIPSVAKATFNSRILPGQTSDDVLNFVIKAVNDERVNVKKQTISLMEPSPVTSFDHPSFKKLEKVIYKSVPNAIVSPFLLIGATDSRYFRGFSEAVLNFAPVADVKGFHGIDERIGKTDLTRTVQFYKQVIKD
jgi:carboxypeptidase PM20D1